MIQSMGKQDVIFFDVSDLLAYLIHHTTLSGIQRVQCEILSNLVEIQPWRQVRFVVLDQLSGLGTIDERELLEVIADVRSNTTLRDGIESRIRGLINRAIPYVLQPRDIFLTIGAFWGMNGMGLTLQRLKNSGAIVGIFIHDIIPIDAPEYFETGATKLFVKGITEALTFADFILTTSEYNREALARHLASRKRDPLPIHLVPLGGERPLPALSESKISGVVQEIAETEYVLCVGTIEVRKNPAFLLNIWKMLIGSGRANVPYLVFAGRRGWLVRDFLDQLAGCRNLDGAILLVSNVTDVELDLLYRNCMLTVFPSFLEGWGLPVGESLAHGKVTMCSDTGGVPEVGGDLVDYIDPFNASDGFKRIVRYLDDPELRHDREQEIASRHACRPWLRVAEDLLGSSRALARFIQPNDGIAAITLPQGRYMPIGGDPAATALDAMDGALSAELICIAGWSPDETAGARAVGATSTVRFRTAAPIGTKVNVLLRLCANGRDFRIRMRSVSGRETEVAIAAGTEKMGVVSCAVTEGQLVTISLSAVSLATDATECPSDYHWVLKGILYFDPKLAAAQAISKLRAGHNPLLTEAIPAARAEGQERPQSAATADSTLLWEASMDGSRQARSFGGFLQAADSYWPLLSTTDRDAPIFASQEDRQVFYASCSEGAHGAQIGTIEDSVQLVRRSDQFVSMSRFSEGSVFDRGGVWRGMGYLQNSPPHTLPFMSKAAEGVRIDDQALSAAPQYDHSYLIFFNGNLHNYYHWLVEGLLGLDVLSRAMGLGSKLRILLPKSMDINALIDHRESITAAGFGGLGVEEVSAPVIRVREAVWVHSDLVEWMPAPFLRDFQQRISTRYAGLESPRNRRLLIARKGPTRKIHNIEEVQSLLSKYDFETVYLEGLSMKDQILLFQSAEFIVGPHGAGLANLLFCEPGTKVIELSPSVEMRPFFWLISEKLGLVHGMQFCPTVPEHDFQASLYVDTKKLQALIRMVNAHY